MSRSKNSIKNVSYALVGQAFGLIVSFVSRIFFINILGKEYLGLNGLFSNILSVLSLAELGVGEAIIFGLYKPLAEKDEFKCKMLMQFYKKIYIVVGLLIFVLGILITPFLNVFIKEIPNINGISLIYLLFVINTSVSYFFSYKRNLIIADQKKYYVTIYRYLFFFIVNLLQIIYLLLFKDYIGFLIIQIIFTVLENITISKKADLLYPYLKDKKSIPLDEESKRQIIVNTKALMMHKVGGVAVSATDNIILSSFVSVSAVGIYSNYFLVTNALNVITSQIFSSITASVGNLFAIGNKNNQYSVFKKIDFLCYWIQCFTAACLITLFNPFISLWLGKDYLFNFEIVLILVINYYIYGMRKSVVTFKEAAGLFTADKWKSIIEGIINLIVSIILVNKIGIVGVFVGTLISSLLTCVWIEPFALFKYGFKIKPFAYFNNYIIRFFITSFICFINYKLAHIVIFSNVYFGFIYMLLISLVIPNIIMIIIFHKSEEFNYYKNYFFKFLNKIKKKLI